MFERNCFLIILEIDDGSGDRSVGRLQSSLGVSSQCFTPLLSHAGIFYFPYSSLSLLWFLHHLPLSIRAWVQLKARVAFVIKFLLTSSLLYCAVHVHESLDESRASASCSSPLLAKQFIAFEWEKRALASPLSAKRSCQKTPSSFILYIKTIEKCILRIVSILAKQCQTRMWTLRTEGTMNMGKK